MRGGAPTLLMLLASVLPGCSIDTAGLASSRDAGGDACTGMDLCDGRDDDCDPSSADGSDEAMLGEPCDGVDADECIEGVLECNLGRLECVEPGAGTLEVCGGGDEDCDGVTDEAGASDARTWFEDLDGDFVGGTTTVADCEMPAGHVSVGGDCDDTRRDVGPSAVERCDGADNDCDATIDESAGCPWPIWHHEGSAYMFWGNASPTTWLGWTEASTSCDTWGYHLAQIGLGTENDFITDTARRIVVVDWWIGLSDATTEGNWIWEDGSVPGYVNWSSMGGDAEDCAALFGAMGMGGWNARVCPTAYPFICEAP